MAKGFKVENIEKVTREVMLSLAQDFNQKGDLLDYAKELEVSFGLIRKCVDNHNVPGNAIIRINSTRSDYYKVSNQYPMVPGSSGDFPLYHFLNNPNDVLDSIFSKWKDASERNEAMCKSVNNAIEINPFPFQPKGYELADKVSNILDRAKNVNLRKVFLPGLCNDFGGFYSTYVAGRNNTNKVIGPVRLASEDSEYCAKMLCNLMKKNAMEFKYSNFANVERVLSQKEYRKHITDEMIEGVYAEMFKYEKNSKLSLYKSLTNVMGITEFKTKQFKELNAIVSSSNEDEMISSKQPDNYDGFFLNKTFVDKQLNFKKLNGAQNYTETEQAANLQFVFNLMASSSMQSLSGVVSAQISVINGSFHCGLEVNKKYSREKMQSFAIKLLGKINEMAQATPFTDNFLRNEFPSGRKGKDIPSYRNEINEWVNVLKLNERLKKNMEKNLPNVEDDDLHSTSSFKL